LRAFGLFWPRAGREAVVIVAGDGVADGFAPAVSAKGVDVFVLGEVDGLQLGLEHVATVRASLGFMSPRITAGMRRAMAALRSQAER
jgi:hypothetical protein